MKSKIATIKYSRYEENIDLLNYPQNEKLFRELVKQDNDIIDTEIWINGYYAGKKNYSSKKARALAIKANERLNDLYDLRDRIERDYNMSHNRRVARVEKIQKNITKQEEKLQTYMLFVSEEDYTGSLLEEYMCAPYEETRK